MPAHPVDAARGALIPTAAGSSERPVEPPVGDLYRVSVDWQPIAFAIAPGLTVWLTGLLVSRWATQPSSTLLGGRLATLGFALVFLGLALLLVLAAVLTRSGQAA